MARVTKEEVEGFLLGFKTVGEVYAECSERGVTGVPGRDDCCPVANLLLDQFPDAFGVRVRPRQEVFVEQGAWAFAVPLTFEARAVSEFAEMFDRGEFPELEGAD